VDGKRPLDAISESCPDQSAQEEEGERRIRVSTPSDNTMQFDDDGEIRRENIKELYFFPFAENLRSIFHKKAIEGVYFDESELFYIIECVANVNNNSPRACLI